MIKYKIKTLIDIIIIIVVAVAPQLINTTYNTRNELYASVVDMSHMFVVDQAYRHRSE